jgi:nicotinate-nucleotide adenylyltransferase
MRIGLLGGSFNPAHEGHVHLSVQARKHLQLDAVWWLVSPANPFKDKASLAPFQVRYKSALDIPKPKYIQVSDYESEFGFYYTIDTIRALQHDFHGLRFVWLMGADNLHKFHMWHNAEEIMRRVPIAVLDRSPNCHNGLRSKTAIKYAGKRVDAKKLLESSLPAWSYVFMRRHPQSATKIRDALIS